MLLGAPRASERAATFATLTLFLSGRARSPVRAAVYVPTFLLQRRKSDDRGPNRR